MSIAIPRRRRAFVTMAFSSPLPVCVFFLILCTLPTLAPALIPAQLLNVAAAENGGIAIAAFSQDTFDPVLAIDGDSTTAIKGWAFHGKIHMANIVFGFDAVCNVSRARIISGIGMEDHHITEFELWYLETSLNSGLDDPAAVRERMSRSELDLGVLEELINDRKWRRVQGIRGLGEGLKVIEEEAASTPTASSKGAERAGSSEDAAGLGSRVKVSPGVSEAEVYFSAMATAALKLVVRAADSPFQNAVLNEFEAWGYKLTPPDSAASPGRTQTPLQTDAPQASASAPPPPSPAAPPPPAQLGIRILNPVHGSSTERAELVVEVGGVEVGGAGGAFVVVYMDGEEVALVTDLSGPRVTLDRDRRPGRGGRPWGLTWHRVLVDLRDANMQRLGVQDWVKFRLVGPRQISSCQCSSVTESMPQATLGPGISADAAVSSLQVARPRYPERNPQVCAGFMSCGRLALLRMTMKAFVAHMERHEPSVPYEIAWVDQGSGPEAGKVVEEVGIEHPLLWRVNYGVTYGLNTLLFALCRRSKYAMTMEEDWLWREEKDAVPAVAMAIQVMEFDGEVVGVFLRSVVQYGVETSEPGPWQRTDGPSPVEYRRMCQKGGRWGAWTNGAAIWNRERLAADVGMLNEEWGDASEQEFAARVGGVFCSAQIRTEGGCERSDCNAVAVHVGSDRTPGWAPEIEYMGNGQYTCMSYGKPVDKQICDMWVGKK